MAAGERPTLQRASILVITGDDYGEMRKDKFIFSTCCTAAQWKRTRALELTDLRFHFSSTSDQLRAPDNYFKPLHHHFFRANERNSDTYFAVFV